MTKHKIILGIETSCDDTSIAIFKGTPSTHNALNTSRPEILSHVTFSQDLSKWGGVVPEIASRNHIEKLTPLLFTALEQAQLKVSDIDAIGVTALPGLLGPLLTGLSYAKTISLATQTPIIPVNHLFAHLEAIHIDQEVQYPYIGLLISGGHSLFAHVINPEELTVISSTIDDAAGEAFDKGGKLLGLPYPAGQEIDKISKNGDKSKYSFPIGLRGSKDGRMSFSGLKTSLRQFIEKNPELVKDPTSKSFADVCASYQEAIVQTLSIKTKEVLNLLKERGDSSLPLVIGGGVACNSALREIMHANYECKFVSPKFCTDNGAMVANYAFRTFHKKLNYPECLSIDAQSRFISKSAHIKKK